MTHQPAFADLEYQVKKSKTPAGRIPGEVGMIGVLAMSGGEDSAPLLPWSAGPAALSPVGDAAGAHRSNYVTTHSASSGQTLSDPGMEDLLYEAGSVRRFAVLRSVRAHSR